MKIIQIPDEMHGALMELAHAYTTQDEKYQAMPVCFSVMDKIKYPSSTDYNDGWVWIRDGEIIADDDKLIDYAEDNGNYDLPNEWSNWSDSQKIDFLERECDIERVPFSYQETERHMFLTREACEKHIEANRHHYTKPYSYARTIWRNSQMELLANLLIYLGKK